MFYIRDLEKIFTRFIKFPAVAVLGPRQSGKTTLAEHFFKQHTFLSLEKSLTLEFVQTDPDRFLSHYENDYGLIIDEFQYAPSLLSNIKLAIDTKKRNGYFILTGSQNFLMNEAITQSLAGRIGILTLLPLSLHELILNDLIAKKNALDIVLFKGSYPRIYTENIKPTDFYPSYIQTYIERDARQLTNIGDLRTFQQFLKLCAGRIGQLLNLSDLAMNCNISLATAKKWLSILEASYIVYVLPPYFENFNKRLTKTPKIYFYDTGLACSLLGIQSSEDLGLSSFRGPLFENLIIADLAKQFFNLGQRPPLYFWRDQNGRVKVDCLIDLGTKKIALEIKSAKTFSKDYFQSVTEWNNITNNPPAHGYVVYGGNDDQERSIGNILGWQSSATLVEKLLKNI